MVFETACLDHCAGEAQGRPRQHDASHKAWATSAFWPYLLCPSLHIANHSCWVFFLQPSHRHQPGLFAYWARAKAKCAAALQLKLQALTTATIAASTVSTVAVRQFKYNPSDQHSANSPDNDLALDSPPPFDCILHNSDGYSQDVSNSDLRPVQIPH